MTTLSGYDTLNNPDWDDPRLIRLKVPGTPCVFYGRKEVAPYFVAMLIDYNKTIHSLTNRDDVDGYDARPARAGGGRDSDHYGGVAVDVLASGVGEQGSANRSFWVSKQSAVAALLKKYKFMYWGGDRSLGGQYSNQYIDPMHFYLKPGGSIADVVGEIKRMGIRSDGTIPAPKPLSAHEQHLLHLKNLGLQVPVVKKPIANPALSAHQLHMQHLATLGKTPAVKPAAAAAKGPEWWLAFLRAHKVKNERAWFAVGCRESGPSADCLYPAGAPWGDWVHGNGRHFDTGVLQINDRHVERAASLGYGPDMRWALDPVKNLDYALKYLSWSDWGLEITTDAAGNAVDYKFNWAGWPSPYRPGESGAVEAEAGFKEWWDKYPIYAAKVK